MGANNGADTGNRITGLAGWIVATVLVVGLLAALAYALPRVEELRSQVPRLDGRQIPDTTTLAAQDAIDYALEAGQGPRSNRDSPGFSFNSLPPAGVGAAPGHWCAADVIGYRIDFAGAIRAGSSRSAEQYRWRKAFDAWTAASGGRYRFEYRGAADYPVVTPAPGGAPIDLSAVPQGEIALTYAVGSDRTGPEWAEYTEASLSDALGVGGVERVSWDGPAAGQIQRGMVVLDAVDAAINPLDLPTPYVHELGHALGLAHTTDPGQMMAQHAGPKARISAGDEEGIRRLAEAGC